MSDPGFALFSAVLSTDECLELAVRLEAAPRSRAGARHLMRDEAVAARARDERLVALAGAALGASAVPFKATLFDKSPSASWRVVWHQDTALPLASRFDAPGWGPWSVKGGIAYAHAPAWALERVVALRLHLDDSSPETGPLRVLPGSHRRGVLLDEEISRLVRETSPVTCVARRGDALAMRPLLVHASSKGTGNGRRRVLHVEYAASDGPLASPPSLAPGIALALA